MNWFIAIVGDYHDIDPDCFRNEKGKFNAIELGCFPTKGFGCDQYYGLFYQGRRPAFKAILPVLLKSVELSEDETDLTLKDLTYEVKNSLGKD